MSESYDRHNASDDIEKVEAKTAELKAEMKKSPHAKMLSLTKDQYVMSEKKFECSECGQKFVSERAKKIHETTMHDGTTEEHTCSKCNKSFKSMQAMKAGYKFTLNSLICAY